MMVVTKRMSVSALVIIFVLSIVAGVNACDTWVALPDATESGFTIFAKNSDRPLFDCQPLIFYPRKKWPADTRLNLGRITIPQVEETYATMGSSPYWCWGYEEGINEYGVAIGNEGVFTKVLVENIAASKEGKGPEPGLTGMDLVKLGLERGKTAPEALEVITSLTEKYGQFGSGLPTMDTSGTYNNSYIIADPNEVWILETAGTRWIAKRFTRGTTSISNKLSITTSWNHASSDIVEHAVERGWWPKDKTEVFDFESAYSDDTPTSKARSMRAHTRVMRSGKLLQEKEGQITPRWMMRIARDRSSSPSIDLDQTASSGIAILPNTIDQLPVFWWCPTVPSNSCYVPFFIHGSGLPKIVSTAGRYGKRVESPSKVEQDRYSPDSYWWLFRDLYDQTNRKRDERITLVRAEFDDLEKEFEAEVPEVINRAVELRKAGRVDEAAKILDTYTAECLDRVLRKVKELHQRFETEVVEVSDKHKPYLGKYLATHKDEQLTVLVQNAHLAVDIPEQMVYELKEPYEEGKWYFVISDKVAVSFDRDDAGNVIVMKLHQNGLTFELIRDGVELPMEINLDKAQKYLGSYHSEKYKTTMKVFIQNNRLAIDWPERLIFELRPPDEKGIWAFRLGNVSTIKFNESPDGQIESLTYYQDDVVDEEMKRIKDKDADTSPVLKQRLDRLVNQLERKREQFHIPGMAIAVVKDDQVILTQGFGMADIQKKKPVTPETIFAIGSTTKAFTATLIGMLVDEGKMSWDETVTKYIPYFTLDIDSEDESAKVTIRDLLCHRTGFTRMSILFSSGTVPRQEILHTAIGAEPWTGFRKKFYYNNVMYLAAGVAARIAADSDWDTLITERILKPLSMGNSNTSIEQSQADERLSLGYIWEEDRQMYRHLPMRVLDNIAPAGAINSNVLDMAKWVRFLLSHGVFEGQRLISEAQLRETWTKQIEIAQGVSYGFGWLLHQWKEQPVIEHHGNIDGFAAQIALLPESSLGFVLLTNVTGTPLQMQSSNIVWEALLGEWEDADSLATSEFEPYLGKYIANFGQFKDAEYTVLIQEGHLAIDVPGQGVYELKEPDEEGKWYFVISDQIAVSFERDKTGKVMAMKLHQSGLTFELPRVGVERPPEIPLDELEKYLGKYYSESLNETMEMVIKNNCLALSIPGQKTYELRAPNEKSKWLFRVVDQIAVSFSESDTGQILSMTYHEGDHKIEFQRVGSENTEPLPTVAQLLALREVNRRKAALEKMGTFRLTGTVRLAQSGVKGIATWYVAGSDRHHLDLDYGKFGHVRLALGREQAWTETPYGRLDELRGKFHEQAKHGHPAAIFGDWRDFFDSVRVLRADKLDGRNVYILRLTSGETPAYIITVDANTGDTLKAMTATVRPGSIVSRPMVIYYQDYRDVDGLRIPVTIISENEEEGKIIMQFETIETNLKIGDEIFILSPPLK